MTERRYTDEEISTILARAAEGSQRQLQSARNDGFTLADLQEIGREAGIAPEAVAAAARSLELAPPVASRRFLGLPIGVERTVSLERRLTDAEWEQLVVQFREVFEARGTMSASGNFRQWTNGNLQALLEPTPTGHRLRLKTTKGIARARITAGLGMIGVGTVLAVATSLTGHVGNAAAGIAMMLGMGTVMIGLGAASLPSWARRRTEQMESITTSLALAGDAPASEQLTP